MSFLLLVFRKGYVRYEEKRQGQDDRADQEQAGGGRSGDHRRHDEHAARAGDPGIGEGADLRDPAGPADGPAGGDDPAGGHGDQHGRGGEDRGVHRGRDTET